MIESGEPQRDDAQARPGGRAVDAAQRFKVDYFISRRGASAEVAQEVADVLLEAGHTVRIQDYDFVSGMNFVAAMDDALKRCRHFIALLSADYDEFPFTGAEWTGFLASSLPGGGRRFILLRVEDCRLDGLLAAFQYTDLVGVQDAQERKSRILAAVEGVPHQGQRKVSPARTFHGVPARNPHFTGRDGLLDRLHETLMGSDSRDCATQIALHGMGGIGKTSIVAEYAHRHGVDYAGVWWAPAQNRAVLTTSLAAFATELDPQLAGEDDVKIAALSALHKISRSATPWLLVYDNVESPDLIADLVPGRGARLVITTRWADWLGRAAEIEVDLLEPEAATEFLLTRSGRSDREGAVRLAAALENLPLALDHAGAYVRLTGMSFDRYGERLEDLIAKAPRGAAYPESVGATFGLAIEQAGILCPPTEPLLAFFAVLGPDRIPFDLVDDFDPRRGRPRRRADGAHGGVACRPRAGRRRHPGGFRASPGARGHAFAAQRGGQDYGRTRHRHSAAGSGISRRRLWQPELLAALRAAAAARARFARGGAARRSGEQAAGAFARRCGELPQRPVGILGGRAALSRSRHHG